MKKPLIILAGPTAAGKTRASIGLAKKAGGEIISADSMQIYKYMDIGSAKIRPEEMEGIPHYLVDELLPEEEFHVVRFQEMARRAMNQIYERGKIPILVGGTGFYIQAVLYDIDFTEAAEDIVYRNFLEELAQKRGVVFLHEMLEKVDQEAAQAIHANNVRRVIRALEYHHQTGAQISAHNQQQRQKESPYCYAYFVLTDERKHLYDRINTRVDQMMKEGFLDEVQALKARGCTREMTSMHGLGYKELLQYLDGECSLSEAVENIKRDTRHFAKRQITWFKREPDVIWLNKQDYGYRDDDILEQMLKELKQRNILA